MKGCRKPIDGAIEPVFVRIGGGDPNGWSKALGYSVSDVPKRRVQTLPAVLFDKAPAAVMKSSSGGSRGEGGRRFERVVPIGFVIKRLVERLERQMNDGCRCDDGSADEKSPPAHRQQAQAVEDEEKLNPDLICRATIRSIASVAGGFVWGGRVWTYGLLKSPIKGSLRTGLSSCLGLTGKGAVSPCAYSAKIRNTRQGSWPITMPSRPTLFHSGERGEPRGIRPHADDKARSSQASRFRHLLGQLSENDASPICGRYGLPKSVKAGEDCLLSRSHRTC